MNITEGAEADITGGCGHY